MQIAAPSLNDRARFEGFDAGRAYMASPDTTTGGGLPAGWWLLPCVLGGTGVWAWVVMSLFG